MHSLLEELSHHCHFQIHIMSFFVSFDKGSMKKHAVENDLPEQKPKTKKAKLAELLQVSSNLPKHSQNALAAIPDLHSSNHQREARLQLLDSCHGGALGPLIQEANLVKDDGTTTTMFFANLLVYMMAIYHQDGTISVERSTFVATLDGGIAQMMGHVLQSIFCCPIQEPRLGFRLKATSGDTTLFFNLSMVLADGAAQKQVWSSKGDSGTKFCLLCANVHGQVAKHADEEPYEFHCATTQYSQLRLVTDQELLDSYPRLHTRSSSCTKKAFAVATSHWLDILEICLNVEPAIAGKRQNQTSHTVLP